MCLSLLIMVGFLAGYACCSRGIPYSGTSQDPSCLAHLLVERWTLCAESPLAPFPSAKECLVASTPRWDWVWPWCPNEPSEAQAEVNSVLSCLASQLWAGCTHWCRQEVLAAFSWWLSDFKWLDKVYNKKCVAVSGIATYKLLKYQGCLNLQAICCARKCGF